MRIQDLYVKQATTLAIALSCIALSAVGGADKAVEKRTSIADQELFFAPVPKAVCGPGDKPESGLQGQVPIALRMQPGGFQGFSCNLQLLGQVRGDGANWQSAEWREGKGKTKRVCAYHGTAAPSANTAYPRTNYGVRALDVTDPTRPYTTTYLTTSAMLDPWESLKINERRQLLGAVNGQNGGGGAEIDIYDISGDCRYPQLLTSTALLRPDGLPIIGHEGSWAPDGLTYYGADLRFRVVTSVSTGQYYAIDTSNTLQPKLITAWQTDVPGANIHGLAISEDGNRGYFVSIGSINAGTLLDPTVPANNGLLIYDMTDVQSRRPNPQVRLVSSIFWKDGSTSQHTIPIHIKGKPYVVFVDEGGSPGVRTIGCPAGFAVFPMARIIDMSDETKPKIVSKLMLEVHDPANCDKVIPDLVGLTSFLYGSHYCSVDNRKKATTLACGYLNSGIRVFDIRDPIRPREIAYFNPPATPNVSPGSNHVTQRATQQPGGPDWCSAAVHLDVSQGTLWTTCQDNGVLTFKFTHNAWPFAESTTPPGWQTN